MLQLRPVIDEDCRLLWEWANESGARASAFRSDPISWIDHQQWFRSKRCDPSCRMYVLMDQQQTPVGQVRFDLQSDGIALIDISVSRDHRCLGYGEEALRLACDQVSQESTISEFRAAIKVSNQVSIRAFEKAGFERQGMETMEGQEAILMRLVFPHGKNHRHVR